MPQVNLIIDDCDLERVDASAKLLGLSRSAFLRKSALTAAAAVPAALVAALDERDAGLKRTRETLKEGGIG